MEITDDLSDSEFKTRTVVSAVPVSPSSVVTECYEDVPLDSNWEFVEPRSSSLSRKRSIVWGENRGAMSYEGTPEKAPPYSRRRMMPPTRRMKRGGKRRWRNKEVFGVLAKEQQLQ